MLLYFALALVVIWIAAVFFFHVVGFLIHILLVVAAIALVVHLFSGKKKS